MNVWLRLLKVIGRGVLLLVVCLAASAVGADSPEPVSPDRVQYPPPNLPLPVPVEAHALKPDAFLRSTDQEEIDTQTIEAGDRTPFPNCRLGVAAVSQSPTAYPGYEQLNLGAYVNFETGTPNPALPPGLEYIQTIRLEQEKGDPSGCPDYRDCYAEPITYTLKSPGSLPALRALVADNPGSLWLVGNEPDRRSWWEEWGWVGQDETTPELYARAYCEISREIQQVDPRARVGIGGVVEGTPLRLEYLDRVWAEYPNVCGGRQLGDDVDVWNVHSFVLREASVVCYPSPYDHWGAEIPTGLDYCEGMWYSEEDNGSLDLFKEQIVRFRTWMRDKGERNKPLIISEAGLTHGTYWFLPDEVKSFMNGVLDYVLNEKDAALGYPVDDNRLVQQFLWWSLNSDATIDYSGQELPPGWPPYPCYPSCTLSVDSLYGEVTEQAYRDNWVAYVQSHTEANTPYVNLLVDGETIPSSYFQPSEPVTFTLRATVYNNGNTRTTSGDGSIEVRFYEGTPDNPGVLIGTHAISDVYGCGSGIGLEQLWAITETVRGIYPWYVEAETLPGESSEEDNRASDVALVGPIPVYLPIVMR